MTERKGFQPTLDTQVQRTPRATLEMKRSDLAPKVRSYADNLAVQIRNILAAHNITSIEEFEQLAKDEKRALSQEDIRKLQKFLGLLQECIEKGDMPFSATIICAESQNKNIINPFAEVLAENGVSGKETLDTLEIDLGEILESCKETYRRKGLDTWANALPTNTSDIISSDPKKLERFKDYLKEGRIPVFMPSASVQLATMKSMVSGERFSHFKPDITSTDANGTPSTTEANNGYISWAHFRNLMASENQTLVSGVPDHWYIMWEKPTAEPEAINKNLAKQEQHIRQAQKDFKKKHHTQKPLIGGIMPAEYLALQIVFPDLVKIYAQKERVSIQTLNPLDNKTYTRFPGVEEAGGIVAGAAWNPGGSQLELGRLGGDADSDGGVRLPVREVKITP